MEKTNSQIMFDFEKLQVYSHAKYYNRGVKNLLKNHVLEKGTKDQLHRASLSILLNIAEGSGRFSKADKRNFYVIARGSCFECVAIFDYLKDEGEIDGNIFAEFYSLLEEISKMLYAMIRNLQK